MEVTKGMELWQNQWDLTTEWVEQEKKKWGEKTML